MEAPLRVRTNTAACTAASRFRLVARPQLPIAPVEALIVFLAALSFPCRRIWPAFASRHHTGIKVGTCLLICGVHCHALGAADLLGERLDTPKSCVLSLDCPLLVDMIRSAFVYQLHFGVLVTFQHLTDQIRPGMSWSSQRADKFTSGWRCCCPGFTGLGCDGWGRYKTPHRSDRGSETVWKVIDQQCCVPQTQSARDDVPAFHHARGAGAQQPQRILRV